MLKRSELRRRRPTPRASRDGSAFRANVAITPIRDEAGLLVGFAKVTRDLTERKNAEVRLAESERLLRSTLDALDSAIAILDENGVILTTNHAWDQLAHNQAFTSSPVARVRTTYGSATAWTARTPKRPGRSAPGFTLCWRVGKTPSPTAIPGTVRE
jgi:transcriptional regulator with PAS, ATPase and Fis domain